MYIIAIIICFALGLYFYKDFFELSLSGIDTQGVVLANRTIAGRFNYDLMFAVFIGLLPLFYLLIKRITNISFLYKGLIAVLIIIVTGIIFWQLRIFGLNAQFEEISLYELPQDLTPEFDVGNFKFGIYLFMGFIVGTLISILIFRNKSEPLLN